MAGPLTPADGEAFWKQDPKVIAEYYASHPSTGSSASSSGTQSSGGSAGGGIVDATGKPSGGSTEVKPGPLPSNAAQYGFTLDASGRNAFTPNFPGGTAKNPTSSPAKMYWDDNTKSWTTPIRITQAEYNYYVPGGATTTASNATGTATATKPQTTASSGGTTIMQTPPSKAGNSSAFQVPAGYQPGPSGYTLDVPNFGGAFQTFDIGTGGAPITGVTPGVGHFGNDNNAMSTGFSISRILADAYGGGRPWSSGDLATDAVMAANVMYARNPSAPAPAPTPTTGTVATDPLATNTAGARTNTNGIVDTIARQPFAGPAPQNAQDLWDKVRTEAASGNAKPADIAAMAQPVAQSFTPAPVQQQGGGIDLSPYHGQWLDNGNAWFPIQGGKELPADIAGKIIQTWSDRPNDIAQMLAIATRESGGNPRAQGINGPETGAPGSADTGVFQINDLHRQQGGVAAGLTHEQLMNPDTNIQVARALYDRNSGTSAWGGPDIYNPVGYPWAQGLERGAPPANAIGAIGGPTPPAAPPPPATSQQPLAIEPRPAQLGTPPYQPPTLQDPLASPIKPQYETGQPNSLAASAPIKPQYELGLPTPGPAPIVLDSIEHNPTIQKPPPPPLDTTGATGPNFGDRGFYQGKSGGLENVVRTDSGFVFSPGVIGEGGAGLRSPISGVDPLMTREGVVIPHAQDMTPAAVQQLAQANGLPAIAPSQNPGASYQALFNGTTAGLANNYGLPSAAEIQAEREREAAIAAAGGGGMWGENGGTRFMATGGTMVTKHPSVLIDMVTKEPLAYMSEFGQRERMTVDPMAGPPPRQSVMAGVMPMGQRPSSGMPGRAYPSGGIRGVETAGIRGVETGGIRGGNPLYMAKGGTVLSLPDTLLPSRGWETNKGVPPPEPPPPAPPPPVTPPPEVPPKGEPPPAPPPTPPTPPPSIDPPGVTPPPQPPPTPPPFTPPPYTPPPPPQPPPPPPPFTPPVPPPTPPPNEPPKLSDPLAGLPTEEELTAYESARQRRQRLRDVTAYQFSKAGLPQATAVQTDILPEKSNLAPGSYYDTPDYASAVRETKRQIGELGAVRGQQEIVSDIARNTADVQAMQDAETTLRDVRSKLGVLGTPRDLNQITQEYQDVGQRVATAQNYIDQLQSTRDRINTLPPSRDPGTINQDMINVQNSLSTSLAQRATPELNPDGSPAYDAAALDQQIANLRASYENLRNEADVARTKQGLQQAETYYAGKAQEVSPALAQDRVRAELLKEELNNAYAFQNLKQQENYYGGVVTANQQRQGSVLAQQQLLKDELGRSQQQATNQRAGGYYTSLLHNKRVDPLAAA